MAGASSFMPKLQQFDYFLTPGAGDILYVLC